MPKQSNHKSLTRQWQMLQFIPHHGAGLSAAELRDRLDDIGFVVTKRTVERDLRDLSDVFEVEADSGYPQLWKWRGGQDAAFVGMTLTEAVSLVMVEEHLRASLPNGLLSGLEGRFAKARKILADQEGNARAAWPSRVANVPQILPMLPPRIAPDILQTVQRAVMDGRRLDAEYQSMTSDKARRMVLHPLGLVQQGSVLYLVATANEHEDLRTFALHRVRSAALMDDKIIRPRGFTLRGYLEGGAFQFGSKAMIALKAMVTPQLAGYLDETPLSKDQKLKAKGVGFILTATVQRSWLLRFWILSQSDEITIVQPKSLREEIQTALGDAHSNYQ